VCELLKTWPVAAYCEHFPPCVVDFPMTLESSTVAVYVVDFPMTLESSTVAVYVMKRCNFAKSVHFGEEKKTK